MAACIFCKNLLGVSSKKWDFYGQADHKGWRLSYRPEILAPWLISNFQNTLFSNFYHFDQPLPSSALGEFYFVLM